MTDCDESSGGSGRWGQSSRADGSAPSPPLDVPTRIDDFLSVADRDELERGFRRLPPEQRALLVLRHFEGREPAEIAQILDIPVGTVRSRLHHAHRAMRAALAADTRIVAQEGQLA